MNTIEYYEEEGYKYLGRIRNCAIMARKTEINDVEVIQYNYFVNGKSLGLVPMCIDIETLKMLSQFNK